MRVLHLRGRGMSELYGTLASRVRIFFVDFHTEMWRFGGMANAVMHNEVASVQHEILPIFVLMTCLGKLERPDARAPRIFLETLPSIFLALRLVRLIHWTRRITWTASTLITAAEILVERRIVALMGCLHWDWFFLRRKEFIVPLVVWCLS